MRTGTVTVRRPRVRDLDERFESQLSPLSRGAPKRDVLPDLYLHGLASGDFELALSGLLGDQAALSANTVARVKARWQEDILVAERMFRSINAPELLPAMAAGASSSPIRGGPNLVAPFRGYCTHRQSAIPTL